MKLSHLNLCVYDVSEAVVFFQNIFDFQLLDQKGDFIAGMTDGHGFNLVLSKLRSDHNEALYPKDFHLGFYVETMTEVDHFYEKLVAAGIASEHEPRMIRGGYTLYFTALDGILFEVTCYNC
ncbi:VOC family protein [Paenibacillus sp. P96]|uniref:VOC family protein n=1 Tax=Paenibacillus zeirhizosphaerae TaxID=2987519 RepID=A0ABT9FP75_9BACL|nr:VOC family protein [Paenibacillus sp. P96]MDP4096207.1 VOC family protein [Paenibacillus sp. P96]